MGVLGLWQLLAPVGQPVTLESLENKIFAVDISIWLNQAVKGYRDSQGGSVPNAHLLSLFSRLCKLLFYKIRPIIVFDGGFPELKRQTIINRQQRRTAIKQKSRDIGLKILSNYLASQNLSVPGSSETSSQAIVKRKENVRDEIYKLPPLPGTKPDGGFEDTENADLIEWKFTNFSKEDIQYLNQIDIDSEDFNNLPADVKQEILSTLKESRRHRTWEQYQELPEESNEFSSYQLKCLLKKRNLQQKLEQVQKDLRKINSADFVAQYTNDHVIGETNKIMSDDCSHYVLLKKIIQKKEEVSKKTDENDLHSTSMVDTKNAFIQDMENIDVDCVEEIKQVKRNDTKSGIVKPNKDEVKLEFDYFDKFDEEEVDNPDQIEVMNSQHGLNNINLHPKDEVKTEKKVDKNNSLPKAVNSPLAANSSDSSDEDQKNIEDNTKLEACNSTQKIEMPIQDSDNLEFPNTHKKIKESAQLNTNNSTRQIKMSSVEPEVSFHLSLNLNSPVPDSNLTSEKRSPNLNKDISDQNLNENHTSHVNSSSEDELIPCDDIKESNLNQNIKEKNEKTIVSETLIASDLDTTSEDEENVQLIKNQELPMEDIPSTSNSNFISEENKSMLRQLQSDLESATAILEADQAKQDRQNRTVQEHMVEECKELLTLFGIPYVVSPTEAEAQCAFYDIIDYSHGTITDDSDVWLFGGKRVYKNFFTQQKYVELYKANEIFNHFGMSRKKLINFAMLTGSDYTEGIEGVGPVTAMEILSEFPGEELETLQKFKDWWTDANKYIRSPENKVRAKLLKLVIPGDFPNEKVCDAYLNPAIDDSTEKFSWGRPDLDALRDYTRERFGWNKSKVDDALLPVIKKLSERESQTHIDNFFTVNLKKQTELFPSKRIMSALKKMTSPQKESSSETPPKNTKRKTAAAKKAAKKIKKLSAANVRKARTKVQVIEPMLSEESSDEN